MGIIQEVVYIKIQQAIRINKRNKIQHGLVVGLVNLSHANIKISRC